MEQVVSIYLMTCDFMCLATLQYETRLQKRIRMEIIKFSFGDRLRTVTPVHRRIYSRKSGFIALLEHIAVKPK